MNKYASLLESTALKAGEAIMDVYKEKDYGIQLKQDHSPVTKADKAAHAIIDEALKSTDLPVLSEEGMSYDYDSRKSWKKFWMVDPLDGTKEFIKKNGEFSVNIALIEEGIATFGVVYIPVTDELFIGGLEKPALKLRNGKHTELKKREKPTTLESMKLQTRCRIAVSRSHLNTKTRSFINDFTNPELVSLGSSLKFMTIIDDKVDIYPRFAPTMEWDTAASQAIVNSLGYQVLNMETGKPLIYNKKNLLNPYFICY